MHFTGGLKTIQHNTRAYHIQVSFRQINNPRAGCHMLNRNTHTDEQAIDNDIRLAMFDRAEAQRLSAKAQAMGKKALVPYPLAFTTAQTFT